MNNLERREHVHRQLERRREVLAGWAEIGFSSLPEGTSVPISAGWPRAVTVFLGQELWRNHRFKVTLTELFDSLKRLKLLVVQEAQFA